MLPRAGLWLGRISLHVVVIVGILLALIGYNLAVAWAAPRIWTEGVNLRARLDSLLPNARGSKFGFVGLWSPFPRATDADLDSTGVDLQLAASLDPWRPPVRWEAVLHVALNRTGQGHTMAAGDTFEYMSDQSEGRAPLWMSLYVLHLLTCAAVYLALARRWKNKHGVDPWPHLQPFLLQTALVSLLAAPLPGLIAAWSIFWTIDPHVGYLNLFGIFWSSRVLAPLVLLVGYLAVITTVTVVLNARAIRRIAAASPRCLRCGYERGNEGLCPECGAGRGVASLSLWALARRGAIIAVVLVLFLIAPLWMSWIGAVF